MISIACTELKLVNDLFWLGWFFAKKKGLGENLGSGNEHIDNKVTLFCKQSILDIQ